MIRICLKHRYIAAMLVVSLNFACSKQESEVPVQSITITQDTAQMIEGETLQLRATVLPDNATSKVVIWTSSNVSVASVSGSGIVNALKSGSTIIYASVGTKKAQCSVTVNSKDVAVSSVALSQSVLELTVGDNATLTATVSPTNATNRNVSWSSSDVTVAGVDSGGKVSALKAGTVTVTVTTEDGGKTAACSVTVKGKGGSNEDYGKDQYEW